MPAFPGCRHFPCDNASLGVMSAAMLPRTYRGRTAGSPGSTLDLAGRESEQGSDMLNRSQRSAGRGRCQDLNTNPILKAMYFIQNCV